MMVPLFTHEPPNYVCPFCTFLAGGKDAYNTPEDIIYRDSTVTAFIAPKWWVHNPANVVIIPNQHVENLYVIPDDVLAHIAMVSKKIAIAIRTTYKGCQGTSTRQHNEPAGNQAVWHFHAHVFPRYSGDELYQNHDKKRFVTPEERAPYVKKLRDYFAKNPISEKER
jgi:histidine triad (HIT) family protein